MANDRWDKWADDANDLVKKAIDSGNFNRLEKDVTKTIEKAFQGVMDIGRRMAEQPPVKVNLGGNKVEVNDSYKDRIRKPNHTRTYTKSKNQEISVFGYGFGKYYRSNAWLSFTGWLKATIGGVFGFAGLGAFFDELAGRPDFVKMFVLLMFATGFGYMFYSGVTTLANKRQFKIYKRVLSLSSTKDFASVRSLAHTAGETETKTVKRVKLMIKRGWFKQGHLDRGNTTLMTTDETFNLYLSSLNRTDEVKEKEKKEERSTDTADLPKEVREVLETGRNYLKEIKGLNDRIPGEAVSLKIGRIEELTDRILKRVETHHESADETKKLMKYYLPMITKLLHAYADMDEQPKPGRNIEKSKREIEGVLDSLNEAFEKLLDDLYKETAWDVASDISVLNAMLKREGLKGSDFGESGQPSRAHPEKAGQGSDEAKQEKEGEIKLHL